MPGTIIMSQKIEKLKPLNIPLEYIKKIKNISKVNPMEADKLLKDAKTITNELSEADRFAKFLQELLKDAKTVNEPDKMYPLTNCVDEPINDESGKPIYITETIGKEKYTPNYRNGKLASFIDYQAD